MSRTLFFQACAFLIILIGCAKYPEPFGWRDVQPVRREAPATMPATTQAATMPVVRDRYDLKVGDEIDIPFEVQLGTGHSWSLNLTSDQKKIIALSSGFPRIEDGQGPEGFGMIEILNFRVRAIAPGNTTLKFEFGFPGRPVRRTKDIVVVVVPK
jgi:hypothetical protein